MTITHLVLLTLHHGSCKKLGQGSHASPRFSSRNRTPGQCLTPNSIPELESLYRAFVKQAYEGTFSRESVRQEHLSSRSGLDVWLSSVSPYLFRDSFTTNHCRSRTASYGLVFANPTKANPHCDSHIGVANRPSIAIILQCSNSCGRVAFFPGLRFGAESLSVL
jgi:hypothetical protein